LIKKCVEAKEQGANKINVWGTGVASRDYLFAEDAAEAIVLAAELRTSAEPLNLGNNREVTIRETAETIARIVGFTGDLVWDSSRPDGQPRRRVDASRAERELGWHAHTEFEDGLRRTVDWYLANRELAEKDPN
jgi:nucleoside-diphosphate-sugar epimerase